MGDIYESTDKPIVWLSPPIQRIISNYSHTLVYYNECIWNSLRITVNSFVIIANDDKVEPCFIGRILNMYEDIDRNDDPYRAEIEMYAGPHVAVKYLKSGYELSQHEVIRDLRPFCTDISLETILSKCHVEICNNPNISLKQLKKFINNQKNMYICRYKLIKNVLSKRYEIVPISVLSESECNQRNNNNNNNEYKKQYNNRTTSISNSNGNTSYGRKIQQDLPLLSSIKEDVPNNKDTPPKVSLRVTRSNSYCSTVKNNSTHKLVTPIKIINRSIKKQHLTIVPDDIENIDIDNHDWNNNSIAIDNNNNDDYDEDPLQLDNGITNEKNANENNINSSLNNRKSLKVKRNLNFGNENQNQMMDHDDDDEDERQGEVPNVENNTKKKTDNLNIKIKIIDKGRKTCKYSIEKNNNDIVTATTTISSNVDEHLESPSRRSKRKILDDTIDDRNENELSPRKSQKNHDIIYEEMAIYNNNNNEKTPTTSKLLRTPTRRKSILKTPSTHILDTPKSSMTTINNQTDESTPNLRRSVNFRKNNKIHSYIEPIVSEEENNLSSSSSDQDDSDIVSDSESENNIPKKVVGKSRLKKTNLKITKKPLSASKLMKMENFTPILKKRIDIIKPNKLSLNKSNLEVAREQLHVSAVPKSLPCRTDEYQNIKSFIESKILDGCGGCMYISGVPGTGKTATVTEVIRALEHKSKMKKLPTFKYISINGMLMTEPRQAYVQIYKQLTGKSVSWAQAQTLLEKYFTIKSTSKQIVPIVLLIDELDILCTRRQDVIYNLLDWPTKRTSHLIVLTIANTMDLPERLLIGKVTSRLGLTRLTFQPYTHKQLQEVVTARLIGTNSFKNEAIQLVARKVASVSGDCRRALDICRRAIEIAEAMKKGNDGKTIMVTIEHIQMALTQMIASSKVQAIKNCSKLEQLFLQSVCAEISRTGIEETNLLSVYNQFETITSIMGVRTPNPDQSLQIASRLGAQRLLICEHSQNGIFQKIILNISPDDVHYALKI